MSTSSRSGAAVLSDLAIIGAGSWGTALAIVLAPRFGQVRLWAYDPGLADRDPSHAREYCRICRAFQLADNILADRRSGRSARGSLDRADRQSHRSFCEPSSTACCLCSIPQAALVSATKGIENGSLHAYVGGRRRRRLLHIFRARVAVLSGPTFAREIANGEPAAVVISSDGRRSRADHPSGVFRTKLSAVHQSDPAGVEIGAALEERDRDRRRNLPRLGSAIIHWRRWSRAVWPRSRGWRWRWAGSRRTLAGLAGLGDLVLTCTGDLSRNRRVGLELARGRKLHEILASTKMIAEGVETTFAAVELARSFKCRDADHRADVRRSETR